MAWPARRRPARVAAVPLIRRRPPTPGQRVDQALAGAVAGPASADLARAEAVRLVPVGTAAAQETVVRELDPAAAVAFGIAPGAGTVTRRMAMRVPAIRRGRNLVCGTIGALPLACTRREATGAVTPVRRLLLEQLDPRTTPAYTLTWTVDDLLFHGVSWWRVTDRDSTGYPTAVERVERHRVLCDLSSGQVRIDGRPVNDADVVRFDGPDEGLLVDAVPVVPLALELLRAGLMTASDEVPSGILRPADGAPELSDERVRQLLADWEAARAARRTAYLNGALTYDPVSFDARARALPELAQLVSSELARLLNLPASRIGAPQGSGMTYANTESDRRDLLDTTLTPYLEAVAQRLSMPDVTPRGQAVRFDLTAYLRGTTAELVSAGAQAVAAGFATPAEVRTRWLGLPATDQLPDTTTAPEAIP
jgi:hypothetical protein